MEIQLTDVEIRVLGALIEKERATPEYYPLSLNALTNACNQKSNRDPVVTYDEKTVVRAVESLREKNLSLMVTGAGSRVAKYKHTFNRKFQLNEKEVAVLCILMLRGPQTVGEIRGRTGRLYNFPDLADVSATLDGLMTRGEGAYIVQLPRQPGRKEARYAHLFSPVAEVPMEEKEPTVEQGRQTANLPNDHTMRLEIEMLKHDLAALKQEFAEFKKQFE